MVVTSSTVTSVRLAELCLQNVD